MKFPRFSAPTLLLLPAIIVLAAVIVLPLLFSLYSSFTPFRLTRPESIWVFIGFRNYVSVLTNIEFWTAFGRTVLLLTVALNAEMFLGLGLAHAGQQGDAWAAPAAHADDVPDDVLSGC